MEMALEAISAWLRTRDKQYVCVTGVHGVMESQRDPKLKAIHNKAGMVTPDGMPLVVLSHLLGRKHVDRVYGPDLMLAVCHRFAGEGTRHFFYGAQPKTLEALKQRLCERFPLLQIAGCYSPPFRPLTPDEEDGVVRRINESKADIVWVGLSTPKQERWMAQLRPRLDAPVLLGVGAAFDFNAGLLPQAPRWLQRGCLEWLFRLMQEPRRLWRRYLVNNPGFLCLVSMQLLGVRKFEMKGGL
jgi:N-acetylglucosaminyldiphosphoundecaprenol N-acetyl-beta-D-mannosaminyltransferase